MIGQTVSHYRILEKLGQGGMGVVYKARDTHLDRFAAIKFLAAGRVADHDWRRRFVQEAKAASALNHANIIHIYDIDRAAGVDFIAMEFVEGRTLRDRIAAGPLPLEEVLRYAIQIAAALAKAHGAGIIHRDLKPANLMVAEDGVVKLLDFGLAKLSEPGETQTLAVMGTFGYMSPEQAEGRPADARSDIYSFGAVLLAMLAASQAPALDQIARRCMARSPDERFQTAAEVKAALEACSARPSASIAVLPFANLSTDKENEYFSDGLAEDILDALTRVPGLHVTARTSSFAFRGRESDIREIGASLNVRHILEGSVRKAGNRVRVTAQLITTADGYHVWSDRWDRELADVFAIQDEISHAIVEKLRLELAPERPLIKRYTDNIEAYTLFLQARQQIYLFSRQALEKGLEYLQRAIAIDPGYALAHAGMAMTYFHLGYFGFMTVSEAMDRAASYSGKTLALDADLAEAHAIAAALHICRNYDWPSADREFRRARELNPVSHEVSITFDYFWLVQKELYREAIDESRRAVARDPLAPVQHWRLAIRYMLVREFDLALHELQRAVELDPNYYAAAMHMPFVLLAMGRTAEALAMLEPVGPFARTPVMMAFRGLGYGVAGRTEDARRLLAELREAAHSAYIPPTGLAMIHAGLGELSEAFECLDRAVEMRDCWIFHLWFFPQLDALRADPRYQDLLRKIKLR